VADEASGADSTASSRTRKRQAVLAFAMVDWESGKREYAAATYYELWRVAQFGESGGAVRASCVASAAVASCLSLTGSIPIHLLEKIS
jgi:hypothetical protein